MSAPAATTGMSGSPSGNTNWKAIVARYAVPSNGRATLNLLTTLVPYGLLLWAMYWSLGVSYWLTLGLALVTGGFMIRTFIIMHDCGHGAFFQSRRLNDLFGFITGVLTMTPYQAWRRDHAIHHATSGDLDHRGFGDITTLTVKEYLALSRWGRLRYRIYRHPLVLFGFGPLYLFVEHRRPLASSGRKEGWNVWMTNLAILGLVGIFVALIGWQQVLLIYVPVFMIGGGIGIWMFYVQHQFEDTYWAEHTEWDYATAAVEGSSYLKLPRPLEWLTGYIGLHHVHHLSPRIPFYRLRRCHEENPMFHKVRILTLWGSMKTLSLRLWDEESRRLVSFRQLRELLRRPGATPA